MNRNMYNGTCKDVYEYQIELLVWQNRFIEINLVDTTDDS